MKLEIPSGNFKALLFDCDGTIADSMPIHYRAWTSALAEWGGSISLDEFYGWAGMPTARIIERLNELRGLSMPVDEAVRLKEERYFELLEEVRGVPEVVEQVRLNHGRLPMAVVSGGLRKVVMRTLSVIGLADCFDTIVTAEDYVHGKPHPDAFLVGARRLGVAPSECLVYEDAELGIEAARRAGMAFVRVEPESHRS